MCFLYSYVFDVFKFIFTPIFPFILNNKSNILFLIILFLLAGSLSKIPANRNILYGIAGLWFIFYLYETWLVCYMKTHPSSTYTGYDLIFIAPLMLGCSFY